jgi:polyisoprenoid-binding protein YceI
MKHLFLSFITAIVLMACGNSEAPAETTADQPAKSPACACVDHYKTDDNQLKTKCDQQRKDQAFDEEFRRCLGASILGKEPGQVELRKEEEMSIESPGDGRFAVVTERSRIGWSARKIGGGHNGEVPVKGGFFTFEGGNITGGEVIIDMAALANRDLKDEDERLKLEGHLKSADFFDIAKYPDAKFVVSSATITEGKGDIFGQLTIKGTTKAATLKNAVVARSGNNEAVIGGALIFDRTEYNIRYGSAKFFDDLGDAVINDEVTLSIGVRGRRDQ